MKPILPKNVTIILNRLSKAGFESYIVGGCVRDTLLGRKPKDWDITTSAKPEEIKSLFSHTIDTGIAHGTVTVVKNHVNYELTTFRIDGEYHDCRRPEQVSFTSNLEEDLLRRDFTMNAIAYHPAKGFQDPYGGQADIQRKMIRGVGESAKRFQEDALRMLRAVRFAAQLGFTIETETYQALVANKTLIRKISVERIREEIDKLLLSPFTHNIPLLWESGLLNELSATVSDSVVCKDLVSQMQRAPMDKSVRYALLLQYCAPKEGEAFIKHLKPDNKTLKAVVSILTNRDKLPKNDPFEVKRLAAEVGIEAFLRLMDFQKASQRNPVASQCREILVRAIQNKECITLGQLAITGNDVMSFGIAKGQAVGEALNRLLEHVHKHPDENKKKALEAYLTANLIS